MHGACCTSLGLHLDKLQGCSVDCLPAVGSPAVAQLCHGGRGGDGIDCGSFAVCVGDMCRCGIAVHDFQTAFPPVYRCMIFLHKKSLLTMTLSPGDLFLCVVCMAVQVYFRKPLTICASASASVRPSVISLVICSPAIFPMAASWISSASRSFAVISGIALIFA